MRNSCLVLIGLLACSTALSGLRAQPAPSAPSKLSRPLIAAPPNWVLPASIPAPPPAADGASVVDLLDDIQNRFTDQGDSIYFDIAYKIASPQGLDEAPMQVDWDPSLETLTIHRYRILRDGKELNLLGDGSGISVIQREKNLEEATLDGELTASIQPDDVRVGDIIELSFTRTRRDPALRGKSEALIGPNDGDTFGRLRVRMIWPDTKKLTWRTFPGVLEPKLTHTSVGNELVADLTNVTTPVAPSGAPSRYSVVNAIDISEFPDWAAVSAAMLPFYTDAMKLGADGPVKAEAQRIASATPDPRKRAEMALKLVEEQVRYLFLGMDDGGYVPAAADLTLSRRFGDCKAKAVLLTALLKELGIDAEPVLVNTERGDLLAKRLPSVGAFDHVIVRARIGGQTYWMDGTNLGDADLSRLKTPGYRFGLPVAAATAGLVPMIPEALTQPSETVALALDASAGIEAPAKATGEMRFRGESATEMRMKFAGLSAADRDKALRELWRKNFDNLAPASITTAVDERTGDFVISVAGTAKMDWYADAGTRWFEVDRSRLGWKFDIDRDGAIEKDAPFEVDYPDYWESRETIKLPPGAFTLQGGSLDEQVGGIYAFHREVKLDGGVVSMETSTRALAAELPASKAEQTRDDLAAINAKGLYVRVPNDYVATAGDIAALQGNKTALAAALVHRGAVHFDHHDLADSIADENAAIGADPNNALAHSILAMALAMQHDPKADAAADSALALDSKQKLAWQAKALGASAGKRYADADEDYSKEISIDPSDWSALASRARIRTLEAKFEDALSDADKALAISSSPDLKMIRAISLAGLGRKDEALAESDRAVTEAPDNALVRKTRATIRYNFGERDLAIEDYDALIKQSPTVDYYLTRAQLWTAADTAKRDADIKAALALEPTSIKALALRAATAIDAGNFKAAQTDMDTVAKADKDGETILELRVQFFEKQHRGTEALRVLDEHLAKHPDDAMALNERCWTKATFNLELQTAVADCDASLKLRPNIPATLDSRAFAKLRLGATDAAIADYDSALKLAPAMSSSLYGRAVARARKADEAGARSDLAEARKLSPDIDTRFAGFGVTLPPALASSVPQAARPPTN